MKFFSKRLPALNMKLVLSSFGVLALVVFSSVILFEATKATVVFAHNGEEETVKTHAKTVEDLLDELGVEVGKHDFVSIHPEEEIENGLTIEFKEANRVYVTIDDVTYEYYTTEDTIAAMFKEEDLTVTAYDDISHKMDKSISDNLHVVIQKAFEVVIDDGGKEIKAWRTGGSVKELLKDQEITLGKLDRVEPAEDEELTGEKTVTITRVEVKEVKEEESIAYQTETKNDSSLAKGKRKTITEGKEGERVKRFEVTYENGKEVDRELVDEKVKTKAENKVVAIGTKVDQPKPKQNLVTLSSSNSNGEPSGKVMHMRASAYTANCNGCSGVTQTGINLKANPNAKVIAVDPNVIPLGTKVWVEGYGYAVAGDTGGSINGNTIDVHLPTRSDALRFGIRNVKVIVVQ